MAEMMGVSRQSVSKWLTKARRVGMLPADFHGRRALLQGRIAEVGRLAAEGLDRCAIAARLGLSPSQASDALTEARKRGLAPVPARVRVSRVPVARLAAAAAPPFFGRGLRPDEAALVAEALAAGRVTICPPRTYALSEVPETAAWLVAAMAALPRPVPKAEVDRLIRRAWRECTPDSHLALALGWGVNRIAARRRALGMRHRPGDMSPMKRPKGGAG